MKNNKSETVTEITTDYCGRSWGKIGDLRVWLTFAVDPNGTWVDTNGDYHFNAV